MVGVGWVEVGEKGGGGSSVHTHYGGPSVFGQLLVPLLQAFHQTVELNEKND